MKHKVIFFLRPSYSNNQWLDQKMMQITEAFVSVFNSHNRYPVIKISNYEELNLYLDKAELLFVINAGNIISNPSKLLEKLHTISETTGLVGHILKTTPNETPYLHDQMFIIRTSAFKKLQFNSTDDTGYEMVRSVEDLHDGRAPLYVTFGTNIVERKHKFGTQLLIDCLSNNYHVSNFDNEWRWNINQNSPISLEEINKELSFKLDYLPAKGYCYPDKNTNTFAYALKNLKIVPGLDSSQEIFIASFNQILKFKVLNAWTFDISYDVPEKQTAICPATGFFGEVTAIKSNAKNLILYDKNPHNIQFKKDLYNYWGGDNYQDFVYNWTKDKSLKVEPVFEVNNGYKNIAYSQAEDIVFPIWNKWKKNINIEFRECDLILDIDSLLNLNESDSLIYTSTILDDYPISHIVYDLEEINSVKDKIVNSKIFWLR